MLQLVTERHEADDHAHGRPADGHLRPGADPRAVRPDARPDDRLQGAQGRHDRQHPGHPGRRRQDRRQAARGLRLARGRASSDLDEVKPDKLRDKLGEHRERPAALAGARDHRPRLPRSSWTSRPRGLGDYDRAEVIRLFREYEFRTLVERLPAVDGRGAARAGRAAARGGPARSRCRPPWCPGASAAVAAAARSAEAERPAAEPRLRRSGRLRQPIGADPAEPSSAAVGGRRGHGRARGEPWHRSRRRDPRTAPCVLRDPAARRTVRARRRPRGLAGGAAGARRRRRVRRPAPAPRARCSGSRSPGATAGSWPPAERARAALAEPVIAPGGRSSGHDVKPLLVWELARRDPTACQPTSAERRLPRGRLRHPDRGLHPQRRAAQPVARGHQRRAPGHRAAARPASSGGPSRPPSRRAAAAAAAREPLTATLAASRACSRVLDELELPLDAGARGHGGDRRRHRSRRRWASWRARSATEIARLEEDIYESVGHEFNLGSPKQLEQVLFYELDLPRGQAHQDRLLDGCVGARGPARGPPDGPDAARLARSTPSCKSHLRRRAARAARPAHGPAAHDLPAGRRLDRAAARPSTRTSRTSPSARELGPAHPRAPSWPAARTVVLLAADYSQIELRILAHVSGDVHLGRRSSAARTSTARRPPGCSRRTAADVTADERSMAKMVNFGLAYGMSDFGLATPRRHPARRGAGLHRLATSRPTAASAYYMLHIRETATRAGLRRDAARAGGAGSPSSRRATRSCAAPGSGWPSTCPSRARPRTS